MQVLQAPQTWIAVAAVLVVIAVALIALAPRRRGATEDPVTAPVPPGSATGPADPTTGRPTGPPTGETPAGQTPTGRLRTGPRYVPLTEAEKVAAADPARAGERAKDRLLATLLTDPEGAVDVVAALPEDGSAPGSAAAALLRAGLTPAQTAGLCGVEEGDLADLVARDLGLLEVVRNGAQPDADSGRSRTEEPGRAWASAGSAAGSTTPTTG